MGAQPIIGLGEIASALTAISILAGVVIFKPWNALAKRRADRKAATEAAFTAIAEHTAKVACDALFDRLSSPNGGKSLYDIAKKLDGTAKLVERVAMREELDAERTERLERQVFDVITPKQQKIADEQQKIAHKMEADDE